MGVYGLAAAILCLSLADRPPSAADRLDLRDGSIVLGQSGDKPEPFGGIYCLVRRDWGRSNLPAKLSHWEQEEALAIRKARRESKERLFAWRQDRTRANAPPDAVSRWITRETGLFSTLNPPRIPLIKILVPRRELASLKRKEPETARLLRLGWLGRIKDVESLSGGELTEARIDVPPVEALDGRLIAPPPSPAAIIARPETAPVDKPVTPTNSSTPRGWKAAKRGGTPWVNEPSTR